MSARARLGAALVACALCASATAAEAAKKPRVAKGSGVVVTLVGNRQVKGVYLGSRDGAVWVGMDGGEVGLEKATVLKIEPAETDDTEFLRRQAALAPDDAEGHWELAKWAEKSGLDASAKAEATTVVKINPSHTQARLFLGHEKVNGTWMEHDDAMRSKGLVEYQGEWISQSDYAMIESIRIAQKEASYRTKITTFPKTIRISGDGSSERRQKSGYSESFVTPPKGSVR